MGKTMQREYIVYPRIANKLVSVNHFKDLVPIRRFVLCLVDLAEKYCPRQNCDKPILFDLLHLINVLF